MFVPFAYKDRFNLVSESVVESFADSAYSCEEIN